MSNLEDEVRVGRTAQWLVILSVLGCVIGATACYVYLKEIVRRSFNLDNIGNFFLFTLLGVAVMFTLIVFMWIELIRMSRRQPVSASLYFGFTCENIAFSALCYLTYSVLAK